MRRDKGFSLIEMMVVVAIILVIAAVAIPNFLRAKMAANEASAVSSVRTINTAQITYSNTYQIGYADDLIKLAPPAGGGQVGSASADLLGWLSGCTAQPCSKSGYLFQISPLPSSYMATGVPIFPGQTGTRGFCSSQLNDIQVDLLGGTNCTNPLQ